MISLRCALLALWVCGFADAWVSRVAAAPIRVACVGDSITEGAGLSNPATESYPARLQRLLGTNYLVRNFGVSGRTLLKKGDYPYWQTPAFRQSHDFAPDIVILKLGSNDAKPYNWKFGAEFVTDYEELIASYAALPGPPRILVCTPAPVFRQGGFDIDPGTVRTNIAPRVRELASLPGCERVEFHDRLDGHPEWFPDTVHPNSRGTSVMAAIAFGAVTRTPAPDAAPGLALGAVSSGRVRVEWPATAADHVLLGTSSMRPTNTVWTVVDGTVSNGGTVVRTTNAPGAMRFYRLWRP